MVKATFTFTATHTGEPFNPHGPDGKELPALEPSGKAVTYDVGVDFTFDGPKCTEMSWRGTKEEAPPMSDWGPFFIYKSLGGEIPAAGS